MADFFDNVPSDRLGLAVFMNAGDPELAVLADVVAMLDERRVDCLELAVPFPDSVSDGPTVRASARRALDRGVGLEATLAFVDDVRPGLSHLRIALFVDWRFTVRPLGVDATLRCIGASAVDGLLTHGLPPRARVEHDEIAAAAAIPLVSTCYVSSAADVVRRTAATASAYTYLVSTFGRSGGAAPVAVDPVRTAVEALRSCGSKSPIAVGFGVRSHADLTALSMTGADAAIVGSAFVERIRRAEHASRDVVDELATFVDELLDAPSQMAATVPAAVHRVLPTRSTIRPRTGASP